MRIRLILLKLNLTRISDNKSDGCLSQATTVPYSTTALARPSINYLGVNQTTKQWTQLETYGGKLVENVVQAIARDCLAVAIERLEAAGFPVVFHVHDEVVIDCPESQANLNEVVELMTKPIPSESRIS